MKKERAAPKSKLTWLTIVKDYLDSGLSKETFCEERQLKLQTLMGWCSRLSPKKRSLSPNQSQKSNFIPVTVTPRAIHSRLQIDLPNGIKLAISDVDGPNLNELLRACCNVVNR